MDNRILIGAITAVVVVVMLGGVLMPVIDDATTGKSESNPDAGWIRMNYDTAAGSTYTVTITPGDDGITVANGSDTQTGSDDTIFYADSNVAVWMQDGTVNVLGQNTDGPQFLQPEEAITVTRTAEGVTVASGGDSLSFAAPAWAYVPFSSGSYGYFTDGTAVKTNSPMAAVGGGFAGVYAYNDITRYAGLGLQLQTVIEDGKLTGAYWEKAAAADTLSTLEPFDPSSITLDPSIIDLDPIDLGGGSGVGLMSMPTPTYTDGDWGFDIISGTTNAKIVSYSGSSGDIVVPTTVTSDGITYTVTQLGKGRNATYNVFDTSITGTLTIPEGIETINTGAVRQCNITEVIAAESVTNLETSCFFGMPSLKKATFMGVLNLSTGTSSDTIFKNCSALEEFSCKGINVIPNEMFNGCSSLVGILEIPDTVSYIGAFSFAFCGYETVVIPETVTQYGSSGQTFAYMSNLKNVINCSDAALASLAYYQSTSLSEILDLSDSGRYVAGSNGIPATATVQDNIGDSAGYIGVAYVAGANPLGDGATAILMAVPVLVIFSLIVAALVIFLKRSY